MNRRMFGAVCALLLAGTSAHAQIPQLPAVKLAAQHDSFTIYLNERAVGTSVYSVTPSAGGFLVKESTSMPGMGIEASEVRTDSAGRPLLVKMNTMMGGQGANLDLAYANGHAKGTARGPGGSKLIDVVVPANAVDDNLMQAVLPLLPWTPNSKWEVPVFSGGMNSLTTRLLQVTDEIAITLPAGKVEAYRVELSSDNTIMSYYVSKSAPHRILKITGGGAPFEFVRAE